MTMEHKRTLTIRSMILRRHPTALVNYLCVVALCTIATSNNSTVIVQAAPSTSADPTGLASYFNSARNLLTTSLDAHNQARVYSSLMPNEDPRTVQMLRDTIDKTSGLIQEYQHDGLSNMPPLPNVPGLNVLMRLPDKLLRAELSMLQDGIRMAQEMRERPLSATMNTPRELATMFARMAQQMSM